MSFGEYSRHCYHKIDSRCLTQSALCCRCCHVESLCRTEPNWCAASSCQIRGWRDCRRFVAACSCLSWFDGFGRPGSWILLLLLKVYPIYFVLGTSYCQITNSCCFSQPNLLLLGLLLCLESSLPLQLSILLESQKRLWEMLPALACLLFVELIIQT